MSLVWLLSALWTLAVVDRRCVHFPVLPGRLLRLNYYFLHLLFTPLGSSHHFTRKKKLALCLRSRTVAYYVRQQTSRHTLRFGVWYKPSTDTPDHSFRRRPLLTDRGELSDRIHEPISANFPLSTAASRLLLQKLPLLPPFFTAIFLHFSNTCNTARRRRRRRYNTLNPSRQCATHYTEGDFGGKLCSALRRLADSRSRS